MAKFSAHLAVLASLLFLVGCDHATKGAAKGELDTGVTRELIRGVVELRYTENTDIAFNLLRWVPESIRAPGLLVSGALAIGGLLLLLLRARSEPGMRRFALVLVTAGALGNYLDRVARGYVVDFVHVHHWPIFNLADIYVTVGWLLLGVGFLIHPPGAGATRRETG
jgi:signal peptidase II